MSILITGVAGFIGANLAKTLILKGEHIIGVDNLSRGSISNLEGLDPDKFTFAVLDICDFVPFRNVIRTYNSTNDISEVWHFAANSDIPGGIQNTDIDMHDTFMTTYNTLKVMKELNIPVISFASSSAVYGNLGSEQLHEDIGPLFPISNYGAMKLASEASISAAAESHLKHAFIFRFPNVIGTPATHGVILDFINKLKISRENLKVLGDGTQQKTYLHVDELIDAMLYIRANSSHKINYFNIGADDEGATVKFIAEQVVKAAAPEATISYGEDNKGWIGDVPKFNYSINKLLGLGWSPKLSSRESVLKAIQQILVENKV